MLKLTETKEELIDFKPMIAFEIPKNANCSSSYIPTIDDCKQCSARRNFGCIICSSRKMLG